MAGPLVATKFHVPKRRATTVARPHLTQRLSAEARLILVAAPAGCAHAASEWVDLRSVDIVTTVLEETIVESCG